MITISEIEEAVKAHMKNNIQSVIEGDQKSVQLFYVRPSDVVDYMEELGGEWDEDLNPNGWSWDYWTKFTLNDETYTLSGDGFASDSALFEKK